MTAHKGSCHCGNVKFEVELNLQEAMACNCSICLRKGTLFSFVSADKFKLKSGNENLTDYQFGKKSIHHTFCSTCGVTAFVSGKMPDGSPVMAINVRCLEEVEIEKLVIKNFDGKAINI
ncbi:MAG: GFA family protein [Deltaproteobacteria bacterium]|nr:GFA family protein [Deltaproteobacteria bacterium]